MRFSNQSLFKLAGESFATKAEIVALLEGLVQAKALGLFNFVVWGDSTVLISWVGKKERVSWRLDKLVRQIFNILTKLGCSIQWVPRLAN